MKKKHILLTLLGFSCALAFCGCKGLAGKEPDDSATASKTGKVMLNTFDDWDALKKMELNLELFDGTLSVNRDELYIREGKASAKVEFTSIKANPPSFVMSASVKPNITDVTEFGLYVCNTTDQTVRVSITVGSADATVYSMTKEALPGENHLKFEVDRSLLQVMGEAVQEYKIGFMDVFSGSVFYLDNFYAKTDSTEVTIPSEITSVVQTISSLDVNDRTAVENAMKAYKALSVEYRKSVYNYNILKSAMDSFWLKDFTGVKKTDPDTLLHFDKQLGEMQISADDTTAIVACEYTTEMAYGDEEGSLKVEFSPTSSNWLSLSTKATTTVDNPKIRFCVYNDSDQRKMLCLSWNIVAYLEPNAWTEVYCNSSYLTTMGEIEVAGLADDMGGRPPEGALYFSAVRSFDPFEEFRSLREQEGNEDTVFFFDRKEGLNQLSNASEGVTLSYTEDFVYGDETGSVKFSFSGSEGQKTVEYDESGFSFEDGDWVVLYAYNDLKSAVQLMTEYTSGLRVGVGQWTMLAIPAKDIVNNTVFRFWGPDDKALEGNFYLTKGVVCSQEELIDLTKAAGDYEYSLGDTVFKGAATNVGMLTHNNGTLTNSFAFNPYLIGDEIRVSFYEHGDCSISLPLKEEVAVDQEVTYVAITLRTFAGVNNIQLYPNGASTIKASRVAVVTHDNGYSTVVFELAQTAGETLSVLRIDYDKTISISEAYELWFSEVLIGNYQTMREKDLYTNELFEARSGADENTVFFFDRELGLNQLGSADGLSVAYTTEKAYGDEAGSVKLVCDGTVQQPTVSYDKAGYGFNSGDLLVFRVYYEGGNTDAIQIMLNWSQGQRIMPNVWTTIVMPASVLEEKDHFRFWSIGDTALDGTIYVSKIKAYSDSDVVNLGGVSSDYEYTVGSTAFIGAAGGNVCGDKNTTLSATYAKNAIYVDGEVQVTFVGVSDSQLILTLKNAVSISENDVYMAVTMRNFSGIDKLCLFANASTAIATEIVETTAPNEEGYVTVVFKLSKTADQSVTSIRLDYEDTLYNTQAVTLCISDVEFGAYSDMASKGYVTED